MLAMLKALLDHLCESSEEDAVLFLQVYLLADLFVLIYYLNMGLALQSLYSLVLLAGHATNFLGI